MLDPAGDLTFVEKSYLEIRNVKSDLIDKLTNGLLWNIEKIFTKYGKGVLEHEKHLGSLINNVGIDELGDFNDLSAIIEKKLQEQKLPEVKIHVIKNVKLKSESVDNSTLLKEIHDIHFEQLYQWGWRGHETYSSEELIHLWEICQKYWDLKEEILQNNLTHLIEKGTLRNFNLLDFEKIVYLLSNEMPPRPKNSKRKTKKSAIKLKSQDNKPLTIKDVRNNKKKRYLEGQCVDDFKISDEIIDSLLLIVLHLRDSGIHDKIKNLEHAQLLYLNHDIKKLGYSEQSNISAARELISCINKKAALKEKDQLKFNDELLKNTECKKISELYDEYILPKDFTMNNYNPEKRKYWTEQLEDRIKRSISMSSNPFNQH